VTIWGDYSRIEGKKVFMGVAQIMLDDLVSMLLNFFSSFSLIPCSSKLEC
jgi:hypothetical protein